MEVVQFFTHIADNVYICSIYKDENQYLYRHKNNIFQVIKLYFIYLDDYMSCFFNTFSYYENNEEILDFKIKDNMLIDNNNNNVYTKIYKCVGYNIRNYDNLLNDIKFNNIFNNINIYIINEYITFINKSNKLLKKQNIINIEQILYDLLKHYRIINNNINFKSKNVENIVNEITRYYKYNTFLLYESPIDIYKAVNHNFYCTCKYCKYLKQYIYITNPILDRVITNNHITFENLYLILNDIKTILDYPFLYYSFKYIHDLLIDELYNKLKNKNKNIIN